MKTVTSDYLADKFGRRLEISTIRNHGWLRGSNRRPLFSGIRIYVIEVLNRINNIMSAVAVCLNVKIFITVQNVKVSAHFNVLFLVFQTNWNGKLCNLNVATKKVPKYR